MQNKCLCPLGEFATMAVTTPSSVSRRISNKTASVNDIRTNCATRRSMAKIVSLTIDGRPVSVPEGTLIVNAAKQIGIDIPVFCYHPKMEPVGMCRQCLVEVGRPVIDRATGQPVHGKWQAEDQFWAQARDRLYHPGF